jgi:hypothetical protein
MAVMKTVLFLKIQIIIVILIFLRLKENLVKPQKNICDL